MDLFWSGYLVHTPGCKMPFYDPYHWTIKKSTLKTPFNYEDYCAKVTRPNALRQAVDVFSLDEEVLRRGYNASANDTDCYYQAVLRDTSAVDPDSQPLLGPPVRLVFGRPLRRQDYVRISCEAKGTQLFSEYFFVPVDKRDAGEPLTPGQLNVLILGMDSTSRINFNRRMARTRRFLVEERGAYEFLMYNKVGANSNSHYDRLPAVWKVYKSLGYATFFLEEMATSGLFTGALGFKEAPTDYYAHPMMLLMEVNTSDPVACMGGRLKTKEVLNYLAKVLELHEKRRLFAYAWLSYMSHDTITECGRERFAGTEIGRHEDKTPYCLWVLPRGFLVEHPEVAASLEVNQRRLVTTYDFHATLLSLASLPELSVVPSNKGLSLFRPVPPERTCEDAFVPQTFCACVGAEKKLDDASMGLSFALFAVAYINAVAEARFPGKCVTWSLDSVYDASAFGGRSAGKVLIRVALKTSPEAYFDIYGSIRNASSWEKHVDYVDRQ
ncbi:hypothetical protein MTO96_049362 [Rhipicephalus appendiculatus]